MTSAVAVADVVSKGEFAALINVSPGRVSQYIAEGKLTGSALEGQGRRAKVNVREACRQLRLNLDIGQMMGNGLDTRLVEEPRSLPLEAEAVAPGESSAPGPAPMLPPVRDENSVEAQIKREKLRQAQIRSRKEAAEEEAGKGRFIETVEARAASGRIASAMIQTFEGSLTEFASAIAAKFEIPQRDVLHLLRSEFRTIRERAEKRSAKAAQDLPETVETIVESEDA